MQRVAARFALVAAAGELAAGLGVVPWVNGDASKAAKACFKSWLDARGSVEPAEVRDGINAVRAFISAHGMSRFRAWEDSDGASRIQNLAGFRQKTPDGAVEYFVTADGWREITKGFDRRSLAKTLADRGLLVVPSVEGGKHNSVTKDIPGIGKTRVYHIAPALLQSEED